MCIVLFPNNTTLSQWTQMNYIIAAVDPEILRGDFSFDKIPNLSWTLKKNIGAALV